MIYLGSRYESVPVQYILDERSGVTRPTIMRGTHSLPVPRQVYHWRAGDRLDTIGKRFAGKSSSWWQIMDMNPESIDPLSMVAGTSVVVG